MIALATQHGLELHHVRCGNSIPEWRAARRSLIYGAANRTQEEKHLWAETVLTSRIWDSPNPSLTPVSTCQEEKTPSELECMDDLVLAGKDEECSEGAVIEV